MNDVKLSPIEQIKEEFCSRYGLEPEQIKLQLNINDVSREVGDQILADYHPYELLKPDKNGSKCGYVRPSDELMIWTHLKEDEWNES